jgi:hypothetical protein
LHSCAASASECELSSVERKLPRELLQKVKAAFQHNHLLANRIQMHLKTGEPVHKIDLQIRELARAEPQRTATCSLASKTSSEQASFSPRILRHCINGDICCRSVTTVAGAKALSID